MLCLKTGKVIICHTRSKGCLLALVQKIPLWKHVPSTKTQSVRFRSKLRNGSGSPGANKKAILKRLQGFVKQWDKSGQVGQVVYVFLGKLPLMQKNWEAICCHNELLKLELFSISKSAE